MPYTSKDAFEAWYSEQLSKVEQSGMPKSVQTNIKFALANLKDTFQQAWDNGAEFERVKLHGGNL